MRRRFMLLAAAPAILLGFALVPPQEEPPRLYNPYERHKNGPPLGEIFHKARPDWILRKLRDPKSHPNARMPQLELTDDEARAVMAYLNSVRDPAFPRREWPAWAEKSLDDMADAEMEEAFERLDQGKVVWNTARCSVCHSIRGPTGDPIGGFVDLRVGMIDLMGAGVKLKRDWLYRWLRDPKDMLPDTFMPRFRLTEEEIRGLVEYILRDESFRPDVEPAPMEDLAFLEDGPRIQEGRRILDRARCVVCHDIPGIEELLPRPALPEPATDVERLVHDLRCLTCHAVAGRGGTYAPELTHEGSRLQRAYIREFVQRPDMVRPLSQQMPKLGLSDEEAETLAAFLSERLTSPQIPVEFTPGGAPEAAEGRRLFFARGCQACHTVAPDPGGALGPNLSRVAERLRPGYLYMHILSPHALNPYTVEPDYGLSEADARAIATFLLTQGPQHE